MLKKFAAFCVLFGVAGFVGCDLTSGPVMMKDYKPANAEKKADAPATDAKKAPEKTPERVVKADVGVTGKGQFADSAEKPMSIISVPLATYFKAGEMAVFRIQIPQAMKLYKGENGEAPKTQEEFMEKIIKANQIQLPKLQEGDTYFYDPAGENLMVRTKR